MNLKEFFRFERWDDNSTILDLEIERLCWEIYSITQIIGSESAASWDVMVSNDRYADCGNFEIRCAQYRYESFITVTPFKIKKTPWSNDEIVWEKAVFEINDVDPQNLCKAMLNGNATRFYYQNPIKIFMPGDWQQKIHDLYQKIPELKSDYNNWQSANYVYYPR